MAIEIERKFLLLDERWRSAVSHAVAMRQGYLASNPACSIRVRLEGDQARLNIKGATLGIERQEFEYPIPCADAHQILDTLCGGKSLSKTRHYVPYGAHTWEIDEFGGANEGLVVAEIELADSAETFVRPAWLGDEVSHDPRYYNVSLVDHPFSRWDADKPQL